MTTNAEYVAPRAEEFKLNFLKEADLRFESYRKTNDINRLASSRENILFERFLFVLFFCFRKNCHVNIHFILEARQQRKETFCIESGCRVNNAFYT